MGKFKKAFLVFIITIALGFVLGYVVSCFIAGYTQFFPFEMQYLMSGTTFATMGVLALGVAIYYLNKISNKKSSDFCATGRAGSSSLP